jgi:membrane protein
MPSFGEMRELAVATFKEWNEDKAPRLAAALSYYTIFSLAPLLLIAISVAGLVFGEEAARGALSAQLSSLLGPQGAEAVEMMIAASGDRSGGGIIASIIGVVTLLLGAAGVFGQLQDALNTIWEVAPKPGRGIWGFIKDRFLSFTMVLGTGFLLLVTLILSSVLSTVGAALVGVTSAEILIWQGVNLIVQAAVTFGLFAMIFKVLPAVEIAWSDVLLGAGMTTVLFIIGRFLIDLYLSNTATASSFGAAGSLVVLLIWIFFSAQILFFGAEFTQVYARRYGSQIRPADDAVPVTEEERARQGMPDPERLAATDASAAGERSEGRERAVGARAEAQPTPQARQGDQEAPDSGPGTTVMAGATLFVIVGAVVRKALRRRA